MSNQNEWLNEIQRVSLTPVEVTKEFLNNTGYRPGKVELYKGIGIWDHRSVCANEVIFETDSTYAFNVKYKEQIEQALKDEGIPYYTFFTGGKSFHIHCWFERMTFSNENNRNIAREAVEAGFGYGEIRKWFIRRICSLAGILDELIGDGKVIDTAPVNFADGKKKLIRCAGGKKQAWDAKNKATRYRHYKTWVADTKAVKAKPIVTRQEDVLFPTPLKINTFTIPEEDVLGLMQTYLKNVGERERVDQSQYEGRYLDLHGVTKIMDGLGLGLRSRGAQIISIACVLDGMNEPESKHILSKYVNNCDQAGDVFTVDEAVGWFRWVRHQPAHFWNCSLLKEIDCHEVEYCQFCHSQNKEATKLLAEKDVLKSVEHALSMMVAGEIKLAMSEYILFNSRHFRTTWKKMPNDPSPQAMIIMADSSSGKSFVTKAVLKLFPEENVLTASRLSKQVLNYWTHENFDGKIVFVEELQGVDETSNQLRLWISEGILRFSTVEDVAGEDGTVRKESVMKETKGQPVIITTTAQDKVDRELLNRVWVLGTDLTQKQTQKVLDFQDNLDRGIYPQGLEKEIRRLTDMQNEIKPYHFLVPFMDAKSLKIPVSETKVRRDYRKLVTMVKCVALLYQKQRVIVKDEYDNEFIVCSFRDFEYAIRYIDDDMQATFNGVSREQMAILQDIKNNFSGTMPGDLVEFDLSDVQRVTGLHYEKCRTGLHALVNFGFIRLERGEKNKQLFTLVEGKELKHLSLPNYNELAELFDFGNWFENMGSLGFQFLEKARFQTGIEENEGNGTFFGSQQVQDAYSLKREPNLQKPGRPLQKLGFLRNCPETGTAVDEQENETLDDQNSVSASDVIMSKEKFHSENENLKNSHIRKNNGGFQKLNFTPEMVLKLLHEIPEHPVTFEALQEHVPDEKELERLLNVLGARGDAFQVKPGRWLAL